MKLLNKPMVLFLYRWTPPFVIMILIFFVSSVSQLPGAGPKIVWWDFVAKKIAHVMEYALLFYAWQRALNWGKSRERKSYWVSLLLVLLYAVSDELHQSFTPSRHPQIRDVGFDLLGGFLVYLKQKQMI